MSLTPDYAGFWSQGSWKNWDRLNLAKASGIRLEEADFRVWFAGRIKKDAYKASLAKPHKTLPKAAPKGRPARRPAPAPAPDGVKSAIMNNLAVAIAALTEMGVALKGCDIR